MILVYFWDNGHGSMKFEKLSRNTINQASNWKRCWFSSFEITITKQNVILLFADTPTNYWLLHHQICFAHNVRYHHIMPAKLNMSHDLPCQSEKKTLKEPESNTSIVDLQHVISVYLYIHVYIYITQQDQTCMIHQNLNTIFLTKINVLFPL
jgi:hypothetical protein